MQQDYRTSAPRKPFSPGQTALLVLLVLVLGGCGPAEHKRRTAQRTMAHRSQRARSAASKPRSAPSRTRPRSSKRIPAGNTRNEAAVAPEPRRSLADLLTEGEPQSTRGGGGASMIAAVPAGGHGKGLAIDDAKAAVAGIRKLAGKHLTLYTDVLPAPEVDELPDVFDAAVPGWCAYFGIDPTDVADWHMTAFLIQDKARFQRAGMLPADLPPFQNGYQRGHDLWVYEQADAYYRRHLLLHEGTHGFMDLILGGLGPPWYAEGMAELLGTHRWVDGHLTLGYMPRAKTETPGWGRIKIVKDELAAGHGMMPDQILAYGPTAHLRNAPYGWCWALAAFLDGHPRYRKVFRGVYQRIRKGDATEWFRQQLEDEWPNLCEEWQVFVMNIEYGYDVARAAIVRKPVRALPPEGARVTIAADRGWQSTGIRLEADTTYRIEASGRYQIAETSKIWWCEPGGVTIHYYQGRPLGMLLGAVRDDDHPPAGLTPLARPEPVGQGREWTPEAGGTLYLKINESAADLADNRGTITVTIRASRADGTARPPEALR